VWVLPKEPSDHVSWTAGKADRSRLCSLKAIMSSDMDVVPREDFELIRVRSRAESWVQR
jgi:hypothetical protein